MPPQTAARAEELRARYSAEPKSRHFYPLAEELRKLGRHAEAEPILREGLVNHPTYLSAWVSLGRVLKELQKYDEAHEALQRAFALDANNVVTARLLADTYLALGEKVEAIKKYKLVQALLPATDEELQQIIGDLDRELNPDRYATVVPEPEPLAEPEPVEEEVFAETSDALPAVSFEEAATPDSEVLPIDVEEMSASDVAFDESPLESGWSAPETEPSPEAAPLLAHSEEPAVAFSGDAIESADSPFDDTIDTPFALDEGALPAEQQSAPDDIFSQTAPVIPVAPPPMSVDDHAAASAPEDAPASDAGLDFEKQREKIRMLKSWADRMKGEHV